MNQSHKPLTKDQRYTREYLEPVVVDEWLDLMTIDQWNAEPRMIPDWGNGYWAKDGMVSRDDAFTTPQLDATHVIWHNK